MLSMGIRENMVEANFGPNFHNTRLQNGIL